MQKNERYLLQGKGIKMRRMRNSRGSLTWLSEKFVLRILFRISWFLSLYVLLILFFAGYMRLLFHFTILTDYPRLTGPSSLLHMNPGVSVVPNPSRLTSLIHFRGSDVLSYSSMVDEMTSFLSYYQVHTVGGMFADCTKDPRYINDRRPCYFNLNAGGPCNLRNGFGYFRGEPCFAVKLNRVYGWLPDAHSNVSGVRLKCEGLTGVDDSFLGPVCYYDTEYLKLHVTPEHRDHICNNQSGLFDAMYYPYTNQNNYHAPLVFVQFRKPKRHVVIWVKCVAIAKNIIVNSNRNEGSVVFQILVD